MVQRGHNFAIVDEVDSILIDEARTPLIISGPADGAVRLVLPSSPRSAPLPGKGRPTTRSTRSKRTVGVHEKGVECVEDQLGIDNLYKAANSPLVSYLNQALKAKELYKRDMDYIVQRRRGADRRRVHRPRADRAGAGHEGLHQAIEAKESVEIKDENQTLATITLQNYFRLYDKLAGMTGTAQTEAAEFHEIYKLEVVDHPDEQADDPRATRPTSIYKTEESKYRPSSTTIAERHEKGQPVLVGTISRREARRAVAPCSRSAASRTTC